MWIRTQDKHKIFDVYHFDAFFVEYNHVTDRFELKGETETRNGEFNIWILGSYSTEEQALDIMSQIPTARAEHGFEIFNIPKNEGLGYEQGGEENP